MENISKKWVLIFLSILFLVLIGIVSKGIYDSLNYKKNLMPQQKSVQEAPHSNYKDDIGATNNVINILFLGLDKTDERESWLGVYRSDTIVLVRIDLDTKKIKALSIPRDTYMYLPITNKKDKAGHAYAFGSVKGNGVQASINAVNHFMGKQVVDYYFVMNMEPIPSIVDEIGGVTLDVEIDMKDHGADVSKGLQVLNGKQAFDYIHWRYSPGGDIDRIKRQQKFVSTLYKQQRDSDKVLETLYIIIKHKDEIQTNLTMQQMIGLAKFMSDMPNGAITYLSIPGDGKTINNISYWVPNESNAETVLTEFFLN